MKKNLKTTRKTEKDIRNENHHKLLTLLKDLSLKNNIPLSDWEEKELDADNMFEFPFSKFGDRLVELIGGEADSRGYNDVACLYSFYNTDEDGNESIYVEMCDENDKFIHDAWLDADEVIAYIKDNNI